MGLFWVNLRPIFNVLIFAPKMRYFGLIFKHCDLDALFRLQIPFLTSSDVVNGRQEEEIMEDWWYSEPDT